jgi:hypothetical protein
VREFVGAQTAGEIRVHSRRDSRTVLDSLVGCEGANQADHRWPLEPADDVRLARRRRHRAGQGLDIRVSRVTLAQLDQDQGKGLLEPVGPVPLADDRRPEQVRGQHLPPVEQTTTAIPC